MSKRRVVYIYLVIGIGLIVANVLVAVFSSTKGVELVVLEREKEMLEKENRELNSKLVSVSSLSEIDELAEKLELVPAEKIIYINTGGVVAQWR